MLACPSEIPAQMRWVFTEPPSDPHHSPQTLAAVGLACIGHNVIPLLPNSKRLDAGTGFRHGRNKNVPDISDVIDLWTSNPLRNVGIVPSPGHLCVDLDAKHGAGLHTLDELGLPRNSLTERTISGGYHVWYRLPKGFTATKSSVNNRGVPPGVDLITSTGLVVSSWSFIDGGAYQYETETWQMSRVPKDWKHLGLLVEPTRAKIGKITRDDRRRARQLLYRLRKQIQLHEFIDGLFGADWETNLAHLTPNSHDRSESARDWALVFIATNYVRDFERAAQVLYALLWNTGWPRSRTRDHPKSDPDSYCRRTVLNALDARQQKDADRIDRFGDTYGLPAALVPSNSSAVTDETRPDNWTTISTWILNFIEEEENPFRIDDGWIRIPVQDLARRVGLSRRTISRYLQRGEMEGLWERKFVTYRHDGKPRRDSCIRSIHSTSTKR